MPYDAAWQQVTCKQCGRTYTCTPENDYYAPGDDALTGPEDGYCLRCLVTVTIGDATLISIAIDPYDPQRDEDCNG